MANQSVSLYAVGDIHPDRPNPDETFDLTRSILSEADITFGQFEGVSSDKATLAPHLGRSLAVMDPEIGATLKKAGITVMSCSGNHTMDYVDFLDTVDNLNKYGIVNMGLGKDIDEARKPAIVDIKGTRIGFLAVNAVDNLPNFHAGIGRPGTVPLKVSTTFEQIDKQPGIPPISYTKANEEDLNNLLADIKKLRSQVDVLVWSCHWGLHLMPVVLADYEQVVAHAVIDAGADLILGHHPHLMKGIEVYKGKAIFYSMGNFVFDQYSLVSRADIEKYGAHNVPAEKIKKKHAPQAILPRPWNPDCPRFQWPSVSRKSMVVKCAIEDKTIKKVTLLPVYVNDNGVPELVSPSNEKGKGVIEFLNESSEQFNIKLAIEGEEAVVVKQ
jgi:poly-gamma-glutamate capsule biosynthesis protein CapA/YwtB (metallophosphatase superfamily)